METSLVIATWVLAGIAFWQAWITRQSAQRQLRAYVSIIPNLDQYENQDKRNGKYFEFQAKIKNTGQTPAVNVSCSHDILVATYPTIKTEPKYFKTSDEGESVITLGPGQEFTLFFTMGEFLEEKFINNLKRAKDLRFYMNGTVKYEDIFFKKRETNFCYSIEWDGDEINSFMFTQKNNNAT